MLNLVTRQPTIATRDERHPVCMYKPSYTVFSVMRVTFFLVNRVEHQKLNQTTPYGAVWLNFWCSTRPSTDGGH